MPNTFNGSPLGTSNPELTFGDYPDFNQMQNQFQNLTDKFNLLQWLYNTSQNSNNSTDNISTAPQIGQDLVSNLSQAIASVAPTFKPTKPDTSGISTLAEASLNSKQLAQLKHQQNLSKAGNAMARIGVASDIINNFLPQKSEYYGTKGDVTQTLDTVYDGISDAAMAFGPVGSIIGGTMKAGSVLNKGLNAIGGGTDGMTNIDSILGSSFLGLTPLGLINGFGGSKADTITKDKDAFSQVGASYTGTNKLIDDALKKSGKKYGLFSQNARNKANDEIQNAKIQQQYITDIANDSMNRFNIRNSMSAINGNRRNYNLQGGYQQVPVGRNGFSLQDLYRGRRVARTLKYQKGSSISTPKELTDDEKYQIFYESLPKNLQDTTDYRMKDYWKYNGKPKDFQTGVFNGLFTKYEDGYHAYSVAENPDTGEIEFMKSDKHPSLQKELDWYNSDEAEDFRNKYKLIKSSPYYKYVPRTTPLQTTTQNDSQTTLHKEGGTFTTTLLEIQFPVISDIFREGGKFNIIPEGSLHARKHNMDVEGITNKGIPVVSESDGGNVEQQAEIEREELILRLDITKKIEELYKKYNNDSTQKEKDEIAIQAGKLLTKEILYNTKDNTNNSI